MKKFAAIAVLSLLLVPLFAQGAGLVPCGGTLPDGTPEAPCQLCHLFQLVNNILNWVLFLFVPVIAPIFVVIGGIYMMVARGDPGTFSQGKNVLTAAIIGLIIVYTAWALVNTVLNTLDVAPYTQLGGFGVGWAFDCPIITP